MKWSGRRCLAFVELYRSKCAELLGVGGERTMVATRVAELQTNFGGGKTHSLIALCHLASGAPVAELAGVEAVLVGQMISPGMVHTEDDGTEVRTLWRELAWQLGRAEAYATVTKANDVRAALTATGVRSVVLERLGLRRGDRMGLGGPIRLTTADGSIGLGGLRGPITLRLDQPDLAIATDESIVVVIENLQPAEIVCARYRDLPVVYTGGQFGGDAARLIEQLVSGSRRVIAIVDADLGVVRIAGRVLDAAPGAEIIDVGSWPHPARAAFPARRRGRHRPARARRRFQPRRVRHRRAGTWLPGRAGARHPSTSSGNCSIPEPGLRCCTRCACRSRVVEVDSESVVEDEVVEDSAAVDEVFADDVQCVGGPEGDVGGCLRCRPRAVHDAVDLVPPAMHEVDEVVTGGPNVVFVARVDVVIEAEQIEDLLVSQVEVAEGPRAGEGGEEVLGVAGLDEATGVAVTLSGSPWQRCGGVTAPEGSRGRIESVLRSGEPGPVPRGGIGCFESPELRPGRVPAQVEARWPIVGKDDRHTANVTRSVS